MTQALTQQEFIRRAKLVYGDKYNYSKVKYVNSETLIKIICPIHGEFEQLPFQHLIYDCYECGRSRIWIKNTLTTEEFIDKAKLVHGTKYDYSLVDYKHSKIKIKIICPIHKTFLQSPNIHLLGHGCPKCNQSKGELIIENYLKSQGYNFIQQKTFDDCKGKRNLLPFDFYLPDYNILIEFQGKQHYKIVSFWKGMNLKVRQNTDAKKKLYCKINKIPLIEIIYKTKDIVGTLETKLKKYIS